MKRKKPQVKERAKWIEIPKQMERAIEHEENLGRGASLVA